MAHLDYLNRGNLDYIENLFQQYRANPDQTPPEWKMFFNGVELAQNLSTGFLPEKELAVFQLISAYRNDGHLKARLDPLQIKQNNHSKHTALSTFGLDEKDLNKTFQISSILGLKAGETLQSILDFMEKKPTVERSVFRWEAANRKSGNGFSMNLKEEESLFSFPLIKRKISFMN